MYPMKIKYILLEYSYDLLTASLSSNCSNIPTIQYKSANWKRDGAEKEKKSANRWNIPTIYQ